MATKRKNILDIKNRKGATPIICLTAYTAPFARVLDQHSDVLLVGDSLGMVLYGMDSTLGVTMEMMCAHGKAVVNASESACVIVDMPFGSYQSSKKQAFDNAARILAETGCAGVKLEGGQAMQETINFLTERGIPVMGHVGLMPQSFNNTGGYRYQGRTKEEREKIMQDAIAVEHAGAFSIVLESIEEKLAQNITEKLSIPTIGIGASPACDGQVLVSEDMAGLLGNDVPGFVKQFGAMQKELDKAAEKFSQAVHSRTFPGKEHCFGMKSVTETGKKKRA